MSDRVLPTFPYPAQVEDITAVYTWMRAQSFINKDKIVVIGSSAGAYGAAFLATNASIKAAVLEFGIYDLNYGDTELNPAVSSFLNGANPDTASPINYVSGTTKPIFMSHGLQDQTIPSIQSTNMQAKLNSFGIPNSLMLFTGGHGMPTSVAERNALLAAEKAFLTYHLS